MSRRGVRLVFIGVGGWVSDPRLGHTSLLVVGPDKRSLLLDAGEGVARGLYEHGYRLRDLEAVVVTHLHGDHVLGLPTLVMLARYYEGVSLQVYVPGAVREALETLLRTVGVDYSSGVYIQGVGPGDTVERGVFRIRFGRACHTAHSLAVRVEVAGVSVTYTGDTGPCRDIVELAKGSTVLVHEASGHDERVHVYGHSTVRDAIETAIESGVERLVLVHYYREKPLLRTPLAQGPEIGLAHPGEEIEV